MAKFDRKKFRNSLQQNKQVQEFEQELEGGEKTLLEKFLTKISYKIQENRIRVLFSLVFIFVILSSLIAIGEYSKYKEKQAILESEKLEKKIEKLSESDPSRLKEMEGFLQEHSSKSATLRISKQIMDIHIKNGEFQKASQYAEKIANSIETPKELKAYFYYLQGNFCEQAGDKKLSLEAYKKAEEQISGKKEMVIMNSWTLFQIGRLKFELGDKEGSISDLKKVLELDSEQLGFALKQPKLMSTYLILKINKG